MGNAAESYHPRQITHPPISDEALLFLELEVSRIREQILADASQLAKNRRSCLIEKVDVLGAYPQDQGPWPIRAELPDPPVVKYASHPHDPMSHGC